MEHYSKISSLIKFFLLLILFFILAPLPGEAVTPEHFGLGEGSIISSYTYNQDPDMYIINDFGYKRLLLHHQIFSFYKHLKPSEIIQVLPSIKDEFITSNYYKRCEKDDNNIYTLILSGEDAAMLHPLNATADAISEEEPDFFEKVFCVNEKEFEWYQKGSVYDYQPPIKVFFPQGGESLIKGRTYMLKWEAPESWKAVNLLLYKGNTCSFSSITKNKICGRGYPLSPTPPTALVLDVPNIGTLEWTVPTSLPDGNDYWITIQDPSYLPFVIQSDAPFTIISLPQQLPDLTIENFAITPLHIKINERFTLSYDIVNRGTASVPRGGWSSAGIFEPLLESTLYSFPDITDSCKDRKEIGVNERCTVTIGVIVKRAGTFTIGQILDFDNRINEINEDNNKDSRTITIGVSTPLADLSISDIMTRPRYPVANQNFEVDVIVKNNSTSTIAAFGGVALEIFDSNGKRVYSVSRSAPPSPLAAFGITTVSFNSYFSAPPTSSSSLKFASGIYMIEARVFYENDSIQGNNLYTRKLILPESS